MYQTFILSIPYMWGEKKSTIYKYNRPSERPINWSFKEVYWLLLLLTCISLDELLEEEKGDAETKEENCARVQDGVHHQNLKYWISFFSNFPSIHLSIYISVCLSRLFFTRFHQSLSFFFSFAPSFRLSCVHRWKLKD